MDVLRNLTNLLNMSDPNNPIIKAINQAVEMAKPSLTANPPPVAAEQGNSSDEALGDDNRVKPPKVRYRSFTMKLLN